jgi:tRNA threonylcarbamoyl adenosine modification protein YeaZ/ribosomal-protein-alanine acetyltransferase
MERSRDEWSGSKKAGLAIEAATAHVEILVCGPDDAPRAHVVEDVGHGHTRRLSSLIEHALGEAGIEPRSLDWVATDLGPGSFTGVRVGLATAQALAMVAGAQLIGASSLSALAHGARRERGVIVPLVPAGRRDLYAGFFRVGREGDVRLLAAAAVGPVPVLLDRVGEALLALHTQAVTFVGPGAAREREALEASHPGSVADFRLGGLSAHDLVYAARQSSGPGAGLPEPGTQVRAEYVRSAQAEERVRHRALVGTPISIRPMTARDVPPVAVIEQTVFPDPWPESLFHGELEHPESHARVAEREGALAGYSLAWLGGEVGHLGNLAVVSGQRRRGVAAALLDDLLTEAVRRSVRNLTLEVRVSNGAAQGLYRSRGFRLAGVRRRYYRDNGEDALVMEWRPESGVAAASSANRRP